MISQFFSSKFGFSLHLVEPFLEKVKQSPSERERNSPHCVETESVNLLNCKIWEVLGLEKKGNPDLQVISRNVPVLKNLIPVF